MNGKTADAPKATFLLELGALAALTVSCVAFSQTDQMSPATSPGPGTLPKPLVLSPSHPQGSLGEAVYELQGPAGRPETPVDGAVTLPQLTHQVQPKFSKFMRKSKIHGDVVVEGVITAKGDYIDLSVVKTSFSAHLEQDARQSALEATRQYKFAPAMLDGKPVAFLARVDVNYEIF